MGVFGEDQIAKSESNTMTIGGTLSATAILLAIVSATGIFTWQQMVSGGPLTKFIWPLLIGSFLLTLVVSFVIYSKPKLARIIAPIHAAFQGVFVGALSFFIPMQFLSGNIDPVTGTNPMQTLIVQAILATFGITAGMLLGYATGILRIGPLFQKIMITAVIGLLLYAAALYLLPVFGINIWNGYADTGLMGIGFTVLCVGLASLFLILDFQYIEQGVKTGQPKYMEWVGAWGLMITLVWLYIETLRLLAKFQSSD